MTMTTNVIAFRPRPAGDALRRPRLLIRAAREGQAGWRRERDLARLLRTDRCPGPGASLPRLRAEESMLNDARLTRTAEYDMSRHVLVMIAILAEMRAAVACAPQPVTTSLQAIGAVACAVMGAALIVPGTTIPAHL